MLDVLRDLLDILSLEKVEEDLFVGQSQDLGWGRIFGGQVLGQALSAAQQTVPDDRLVHSLHAYFLRIGNVDSPVNYAVERIRDGGSFTTRRVTATQKDKAIFNLAASFQSEEPGFEHQSVAMPNVPDPDSLLPEHELAQRYLEKLPKSFVDRIPKFLKEQASAKKPIEIRPVQLFDPINPKPTEAHRQVWFRVDGKLPDDQKTNRFLLAYASDFHLFVTALQPHGIGWLTPGYQVASIDHAMYFHRPFRFDEWMLYDLDAPTAQGSRGLSRGRWFNRSGELVATSLQEGLMRNLSKKK